MGQEVESGDSTTYLVFWGKCVYPSLRRIDDLPGSHFSAFSLDFLPLNFPHVPVEGLVIASDSVLHFYT